MSNLSIKVVIALKEAQMWRESRGKIRIEPLEGMKYMLKKRGK